MPQRQLKKIDDLRIQLRHVDQKIFSLFSKRLMLAGRLGKCKKLSGLPLRDIQIEKELRKYGREIAKELGLPKSLVSELITLHLKYSIKTQKNLVFGATHPNPNTKKT